MSNLIKCQYCGNEFNKSKTKAKKYCSRECYDKARTGIRKVEWDVVFCLNCGKRRELTPSAEIYRKFCSNQCHYEWIRKNKQKRTCPVCGNEFEHEWNKKFCSKKCADIDAVGKWSGSKSPCWKGGKLPYYGKHWYIARKEARRRFDYKCAVCHATEGELEGQITIHHIIPFRRFKFKDGENRNDLIANKQENLFGVCRKHHLGFSEGKPPEFFRSFIPESQYLAVKELEKLLP
jgi:endogenous inhibitor of DNA gyrase (YacG/DUF329 family)